jgi:hypothetical protein
VGLAKTDDAASDSILYRSHTMLVEMELPKAFSLRDENEFLPIQHLLARANPKLMVIQVATGKHVNGGCTVLWGLMHLEDQPLTKQNVEAALEEAGFDFTHGSIQPLDLLTRQPEKATP